MATIKIKVFFQGHKEKLIDFEARVIINWINESNTLAEYVSMEFENMNKDDLGASLENASQCLNAIVGMLENETLILKGGNYEN